jgi:hypothetical protein
MFYSNIKTLCLLKRSAYYNAGVVVVNSKVAGLAPEFTSTAL